MAPIFSPDSKCSNKIYAMNPNHTGKYWFCFILSRIYQVFQSFLEIAGFSRSRSSGEHQRLRLQRCNSLPIHILNLEQGNLDVLKGIFVTKGLVLHINQWIYFISLEIRTDLEHPKSVLLMGLMETVQKSPSRV